MIQILYTQDHAARGTALSNVIVGSRHGLISMEPVAIPGLDTLLFWGHGDSYDFCRTKSGDLAKLIAKWKKLNSGINTVELVTCNARHATGGTDPYSKQLKSALRSGIFNATRSVKVKALPTTVTGAQNAFSILLAETNSKSWCYVTGPGDTDKIMNEGANLVRHEKVNGITRSFTGDIAQRANEVVSREKDRKWTMNYGYFNTLRANLVVV